MKDISPASLHEVFSYEPETGILRRHLRTARRDRNGFEGSVNKAGYLQVMAFGQRFVLSRVAWAMMTGEWPKNLIDHRDGNKLNNKWDNLREATHKQNSLNQKLRRTSRTGFKGVTLSRGRYQARICQKSYGYYDTPEEAAQALSEARKKLQGEFARDA